MIFLRIQALPTARLSYAQIRVMPESCQACAICLEDFKAHTYNMYIYMRRSDFCLAVHKRRLGPNGPGA